MLLTGLTWESKGTPEEIVESLRVRLREVAATLPTGERHLILKARLDHPKRSKKT